MGWNADGSLGLVSTGALAALPTTTVGVASVANQFFGAGQGQGEVFNVVGAPHPALATMNFLGPFGGQWWNNFAKGPVSANDESAFAISRNNGETWNQLSLIDTTIDWFNDVAVAPDCTTIYLASVNENVDSRPASAATSSTRVWRTTINPNVAAPLPAVPPLGTYWERVYCRPTSGSCNVSCSLTFPSCAW